MPIQCAASLQVEYCVFPVRLQALVWWKKHVNFNVNVKLLIPYNFTLWHIHIGTAVIFAAFLVTSTVYIYGTLLCLFQVIFSVYCSECGSFCSLIIAATIICVSWLFSNLFTRIVWFQCSWCSSCVPTHIEGKTPTALWILYTCHHNFSDRLQTDFKPMQNGM